MVGSSSASRQLLSEANPAPPVTGSPQFICHHVSGCQFCVKWSYGLGHFRVVRVLQSSQLRVLIDLVFLVVSSSAVLTVWLPLEILIRKLGPMPVHHQSQMPMPLHILPICPHTERKLTSKSLTHSPHFLPAYCSCCSLPCSQGESGHQPQHHAPRPMRRQP